MSALKRRKTTSICWEVKDGLRTRSKAYIVDILPSEIQEMIFKFLPLQMIATNIRLVSRQWLTVASTVLNGAFYSAGCRLNTILDQTNSKIAELENMTELQNNMRTLNILELIQAQYKMLRAVTWRYTHPPRPQKFQRLCFYAGSLLDELNNLLYLASTQPAALYSPDGPSVRVEKFFGLCKHFMNYFERVSERKVNRSVLVSGCKVVDILDCLGEGRQVLAFRLTTGRGHRGNVLCMRIRYVMQRTWLTRLKVPRVANETSWRDKQRFMYMRLRRIVQNVNDHHYEDLHYERGLTALQKTTYDNSTSLPMPKLPTPSLYSGYGEYGDEFFYYGNMNKRAYANKFNKFFDSDDYHENSSTSTKETPPFSLIICVELRCSPELAPLAVRPILNSDDLDNQTLSHNPEFYLKMEITCPASLKNKLPGHFIWEQRTPRHYPSTL
ncbi:uncharacterized protein [Chelonus insularis]|uniref:uncharacterized protein n=1 Tax=Chelonus insularis TaxID=460826 RepID=UPI00158DFA61|nr:uncharacterized protein LOC118068831 [Chelonus insularis]